MKIDIDIQYKDSGVVARLEMMKLKATNFRPLFEYARLQLQLSNAANFGAGGLPSGSKWMPQEDITDPVLMVDSGKLLRSLTTLFGPPNDINATSAEFGTKVEYAKFHQYGTRRMPARKVLFEPRGFAQDLAQKASLYVSSGVI